MGLCMVPICRASYLQKENNQEVEGLIVLAWGICLPNLGLEWLSVWVLFQYSSAAHLVERPRGETQASQHSDVLRKKPPAGALKLMLWELQSVGVAEQVKTPSMQTWMMKAALKP